MLPKQDCKYTEIFLFCKFYFEKMHHLGSKLGILWIFLRFLIKVAPFVVTNLLGVHIFDGNVLYLQSVQWGCFGFDSIRHWAVSTPGVGSLPVNLSFRTYSWQQLLCTRCVVCKAHYLNPRRQGCVADEYPSSL